MDKIKKQDVIIVNEQDAIIWYKQRWTINKEDIYRVSALLVKNMKWEFLLAQRSLSKNNNPWEWSFSVAGTIEQWETYDSNIIKEIEEEIWIYDLKYKKAFKKRIYWKHNFFCQFYISILDKPIEDFKIQEEELEDIRWFSENEILKKEYEWYPISKTLINEFDNFSN